GFIQTLAKCGHKVHRVGGGAAAHISDDRQQRLLGRCRKRPHPRRAAKRDYELAPFHRPSRLRQCTEPSILRLAGNQKPDRGGICRSQPMSAQGRALLTPSRALQYPKRDLVYLASVFRAVNSLTG